MGALSKLFKPILDNPSLLKDVDPPPHAEFSQRLTCFICGERRPPHQGSIVDTEFICNIDITRVMKDYVRRSKQHHDAIAACKKDRDSVG